MKTLRQAAQALCDRWDTPLWKDVAPTAVFIGELRTAIKQEEAQTVEPAGEVGCDDWCQHPNMGTIAFLPKALPTGAKLFTHPAPATEPAKPSAGERDELIATLHTMLAAYIGGNHSDLCSALRKAADMLAADALEIECMKNTAHEINTEWALEAGSLRAKLANAQKVAVPHDALVVNLMRLAGLDKHKARDCAKIVADMLAADALEIEQTCNCRFVGEINTVQCTLHNAWAETLNEQSGYRKELHTLKAQQVAVPQGYVLVQASYLQELCSSIKGDCYRGTLWEIEAITTMLAAAPQPPQADAKQVIPKITVELPDGDQRTVKHWYKEWRNDEIVVSISIDEPQAAPRVPMTELEKGAAWLRATIDLPSPENCYLRGLADAESHHGVGVEP